MKKKIREESGQALIEFAVILPVFMLLLFGMLDFGLLTIQKYKAQTTAYESARYLCTYTGDNLDNDLKEFISRSLNDAEVYTGSPEEDAVPNTVYITYAMTGYEAEVNLTYYAACTTYITQMLVGAKAFPLNCSSIAAVV